MRELSFLNKLKKEESLKLVETSNEIAASYLIKSDNCIRVAKLAFDAGIYENAVSEAYYSIYNTVTALFYKCGIKCENHSGAVVLMLKLFNLKELYIIFAEFKKDRIDNQYYLPITDNNSITKEKCNERILTAQRFSIELRAYISKITLKEINTIREEFEEF